MRFPTAHGRISLTIPQNIALLAYAVLCFRGYMGKFGMETLPVTVILNVLIIASIDFRRMRKSIVLLPVFSAMLLFNRDTLAFIDILAFVYVLRGVPVSKLIQVNAILLLFAVFYWLYALSTGLLTSEVTYEPKAQDYVSSMGFANPNGLGFFGFQIISSIYMLFRKHANVLLLIVCVLINEWFFDVSWSRTAWLGGIALLFVWLLSLLRVIRPWMRYLVGLLPVVLTLAIFYITLNIGSFQELNQTLTGRFSLYVGMLSRMSLLNWLVGIQIPKGIPMDGSYMSLIFGAGIFGCVIFLYSFFRSMLKHFDKLKSFLPFLVGLLACGVAENSFSSATGLSVIFWFLFLNADNLYGEKTVVRLSCCNKINYPV